MALRRELLGHPLGLHKGVDAMAAQLALPQWASFRFWRQSGRAGAAAWCARAELARREKSDGQGSSSASTPPSIRTPTTQAAIAGRVMDATTSSAPDEEDLEDIEGPLGSSLELGDDPIWAPTISGEETQLLAAVDLGTNSFHMVIVKADSHGNFQILDVEKEDVRLGSGSAGFSVITSDAEDRAVAAIKRLKKIASLRGAAMRVVATSAVREARNRRAFVRRLLDAAGVEVEVVSGREEACLIYLGILQAMPVYNRTVLTVDIGGGSTEFVIGRKGKPLLATSLKLGHIRLTERFASDPVLHKAELDEMRRYIRLVLNDSGVVEAVRSLEGDIEMAIGSSGTIETIEQMIHLSSPGSQGNQASSPGLRMGGAAPSGKAQGGAGEAAGLVATRGVAMNTPQMRHEPNTCPVWGFKEREFTREQLSAIVKKVCKAKTVEARAKIPGLPEKRVDVIVGGAVLLEEIFLALGIQSMKVSPYALREGVIVDTLSRTCKDYSVSTDLRRTSVLNLARKFNTERRLDSAQHSAQLAQQILTGLLTCKMGGEDCLSGAIQQLEVESDLEILEAATILHYVGMFISHKGYHKHSHYLIKHSELLLGYTPMEIEMIALLVRYHRKKVPTMKDEDLAKLPEEVRQKIKVMAAVIRIAVALDRCDTGAVERVLVLQDNESCVLAITPAVDPETGGAKDVSLEIWAARAELDYFTKIFKKVASIVLIDDLDAENLDIEPSKSLSS